ncbi:MAG: prepilin-type N-terminal cleavage/methylation domain-containing protein [Candidatus Aminicenantes bacterium]|nr:prepilin-type N-terminal cleavage/methylation domain-containing protein [Candidatus Aminicenantes bacterium]
MLKKRTTIKGTGNSIPERGFTLIEALIVLGLIAIMTAAFYPYILNSLETRSLENEAKDVLTTLQKAKFLAVKTKFPHRVRFEQDASSNLWKYTVQIENPPGTWTTASNQISRFIPSKINCTVDLPTPDLDVIYSALGFCMNYDIQHNTVNLQSDRLKHFNQPDVRKIHVFMGGALRYVKTNSGS